MSNLDAQDAILRRAMDLLSEHFEIVQIFTQSEQPTNTDVFQVGCGNILARQKQIENWLDACCGMVDEDDGFSEKTDE